MKQQTERRRGQDRRQREADLIGVHERRRRIEQRKMRVEEMTISEAEWLRWFRPAPRVPAPQAVQDDVAAQVLERATSSRSIR